MRDAATALVMIDHAPAALALIDVASDRSGHGEPFAEAVQRLSGKLLIHPSGFEVRATQSIPRLANGKIDYRSLTLQPDSTPTTGTLGICPTTTGPDLR